jgi:hypothetical protein
LSKHEGKNGRKMAEMALGKNSSNESWKAKGTDVKSNFVLDIRAGSHPLKQASKEK